MTDGQYYGARKLCHNTAAIYCCVCHRPNAIRNAQFTVAHLTVADFTDPTKKWLPNLPLPNFPVAQFSVAHFTVAQLTVYQRFK